MRRSWAGVRPMRFLAPLAFYTGVRLATWRTVGAGAAGQRVKQPLTPTRELR
jgi:hypothetical protein